MSRNQHLVPGVSGGLDRLKFEIAKEVGVDLHEGYNGDILSRDAGRIGGNMVRRMIEAYEKGLTGQR